jgi:hypothetical protein
VQIKRTLDMGEEEQNVTDLANENGKVNKPAAII